VIRLAVDEEGGTSRPACDDADRHALEPFERILLEGFDVLLAHDDGMRVGQYEVRILPSLRRNDPTLAPRPHPPLRQHPDRRLLEHGRQPRIHLVGHGTQHHERHLAPRLRQMPLFDIPRPREQRQRPPLPGLVHPIDGGPLRRHTDYLEP
jgi:hypothetical protein